MSKAVYNSSAKNEDWLYFKLCSDQAKAKAKISFDVYRLFFDLFCLFFDLFRFHSAFAWYEWALREIRI